MNSCALGSLSLDLKCTVERSRMVMDGAGGVGRGGKFSKAKGTKGVLQNQSLTEPCRLASSPHFPDNYALWGH